MIPDDYASLPPPRLHQLHPQLLHLLRQRQEVQERLDGRLQQGQLRLITLKMTQCVNVLKSLIRTQWSRVRKKSSLPLYLLLVREGERMNVHKSTGWAKRNDSLLSFPAILAW